MATGEDPASPVGGAVAKCYDTSTDPSSAASAGPASTPFAPEGHSSAVMVVASPQE